MTDVEAEQQAAVNEACELLQQVVQEIAQLPEPARSAAAAWAEALLPDSHVPHDDTAVYETVRAIADRWVAVTLTFLAQFPEAGHRRGRAGASAHRTWMNGSPTRREDIPAERG